VVSAVVRQTLRQRFRSTYHCEILLVYLLAGLYYTYCTPCAMNDVAKEIVTAEPNASSSVNGCGGNPCMTVVLWSCCGLPCLPYMQLIPAMRNYVVPGSGDCFSAACCTQCALIQVANEIDLRKAAGTPLVPSAQKTVIMVAAPGTVQMSPA